jgi:hypothetical protein
VGIQRETGRGATRDREGRREQRPAADPEVVDAVLEHDLRAGILRRRRARRAAHPAHLLRVAGLRVGLEGPVVRAVCGAGRSFAGRARGETPGDALKMRWKTTPKCLSPAADGPMTR